MTMETATRFQMGDQDQRNQTVETKRLRSSGPVLKEGPRDVTTSSHNAERPTVPWKEPGPAQDLE